MIDVFIWLYSECLLDRSRLNKGWCHVNYHKIQFVIDYIFSAFHRSRTKDYVIWSLILDIVFKDIGIIRKANIRTKANHNHLKLRNVSYT